MKKLFRALDERHYTIASCESLTGGLFCSSMTEVPHVSRVFKGGIVSYWNEIKRDVVGVSQETIDAVGVVSAETAYEMAVNVQQKFQTDVAVSFTGNAGPDTLEDKPAGLVYTCIIVGEKVYPFEDLLVLPRNALRRQIVKLTAERLLDILGNE